MKKFLIFLTLIGTISSKGALTIINISQFPNISTPQGNYQILFADPGVTNFNMTVTQFVTWLSGNTDFVSMLKTNPAFSSFGSSTNFVQITNSPNYFFTNNLISFYTTNGSFTSVAPFNPFPVAQAELIISNTANAKITNTLPWTAYSLSLGTPVTQAVVATNAMLHLRVNYFNGMYYIEDYGKNNPTLYSLATNINDAGFLVITNGQVSIRH